ncbi:MAG: DpnI domain-containing protein [Candidatus Micrarchaeia archaeon]
MSKSQDSGDAGEIEVINKIHCPNCGKHLMKLPKNYPLFDIQCTGCSFRAQVKTNNCKPKDEIFGAGWVVLEKVLKSGYMMPALIVNFRWNEKGAKKQSILFYPFVPKTHLKKRTLSSTARRANYQMFNYIGLKALPKFVLYKKG